MDEATPDDLDSNPRLRHEKRKRDIQWEGHYINTPSKEGVPSTTRIARIGIVLFVALCPSMHFTGFWMWLRHHPDPSRKWKSLWLGMTSLMCITMCIVCAHYNLGTVTINASTCCYPSYITAGSMGDCDDHRSAIYSSHIPKKECTSIGIPALLFGVIFGVCYIYHTTYVYNTLASAVIVKGSPFRFMLIPEMWLLQPFTLAYSVFEWICIMILNTAALFIGTLAITAFGLNASKYYCNSNELIFEDNFIFDCSKHDSYNIYFVISYPFVICCVCFIIMIITYAIGVKCIVRELKP